MRVDLYTKAVLTVIALCLVYLCIDRASAASTVQAQAQEGQFQRQLLQRVVIAGWLDSNGQERRLPVDVPDSGKGPRPLPVFDAAGSK
jgi:hypothetical protein